jgi:hypothetical protein
MWRRFGLSTIPHGRPSRFLRNSPSIPPPPQKRNAPSACPSVPFAPFRALRAPNAPYYLTVSLSRCPSTHDTPRPPPPTTHATVRQYPPEALSPLWTRRQRVGGGLGEGKNGSPPKAAIRRVQTTANVILLLPDLARIVAHWIANQPFWQSGGSPLCYNRAQRERSKTPFERRFLK